MRSFLLLPMIAVVVVVAGCTGTAQPTDDEGSMRAKPTDDGGSDSGTSKPQPRAADSKPQPAKPDRDPRPAAAAKLPSKEEIGHGYFGTDDAGEFCFLPPAPLSGTYDGSVLKIGMDAPEFALDSVFDGDPVNLSDFRGKWVLLNFYVSWCPACGAGQRSFLKPLDEKLGSQADDGRLVIIGVGQNINDSADKQRVYAQTQGYEWPRVFDAERSAATDYGVTVTPLFVLVRPDGKIETMGASAFGVEGGANAKSTQFIKALGDYLQQECVSAHG
jgi:peroxiredoxin